MIYCFDIDGTLCTNTNGEYQLAQPYKEVIAEVNKLKNAGNKILIYTARGTVTKIDWKEITTKQLQEWGVQYDELFFGKPAADVYIDDRATNISDYCLSTLGKMLPGV